MATSDVAYLDLLREADFATPHVTTIAYTCRFDTLDMLWEGFLAASVRIAALITEQPWGVQKRIRQAFDRLVASYGTSRGLEMPVSVKLVSGGVPR
jgi:hypothetical protein